MRMAQSEILELLEKAESPLSRKEISDILGINLSGISIALKKLLGHHEIQAIEINRNEAKKIYKDKAPCRRMNIYFRIKND